MARLGGGGPRREEDPSALVRLPAASPRERRRRASTAARAGRRPGPTSPWSSASLAMRLATARVDVCSSPGHESEGAPVQFLGAEPHLLPVGAIPGAVDADGIQEDRHAHDVVIEADCVPVRRGTQRAREARGRAPFGYLPRTLLQVRDGRVVARLLERDAPRRGAWPGSCYSGARRRVTYALPVSSEDDSTRKVAPTSPGRSSASSRAGWRPAVVSRVLPQNASTGCARVLLVRWDSGSARVAARRATLRRHRARVPCATCCRSVRAATSRAPCTSTDGARAHRRPRPPGVRRSMLVTVGARAP